MNNLERLLDIMARLRHPETGCPWDLQQDFASLAPYAIEEAHELAEAAEQGHIPALREELGDLLLQVVFHARIAEEQGLFDFDDVAASISGKLVHRHPHVFAGHVFGSDAERERAWDHLKQSGKQNGGADDSQPASVLGDLPRTLPALMAAQKLQERAARHGFTWPDIAPVFDKLQEEIGELRQGCARGDEANMREELGDILFVMANIARHLGMDAEACLRSGNDKFRRRFRHIEKRVADTGRQLTDYDLHELDAWWDEAKRLEKPAATTGTDR